MTQEETNLALYVECVNCHATSTLQEWIDYEFNETCMLGILELEAEDPDDVIADVMMDCPHCGDVVYLSDGTIC